MPTEHLNCSYQTEHLVVLVYVMRKNLCLQSLQERFGGWNSSQVVEPFRRYARTMFDALGGHVKHWTTMNEPQTFCFNGYSSGGHAPGIRDTVCPPLGAGCLCLLAHDIDANSSFLHLQWVASLL